MRPKALLIGGGPLLRDCLCKLLAGYIDVCGSFGTLSEAVAAGVSGGPGGTDLVVCVDWTCAAEAMDGFTAIRAIAPGSRIVVLVAGAATKEAIAAPLQAGADGVLLQGDSVEMLVHSLLAAAAGVDLCSTAAARLLLTGLTESTPVVPLRIPLTDRQREILREVARGASNKVIARKFGISEAAIKVQVRGILRKIGVANRTQAAVWARGQEPYLQDAERPQA